MLFSAGVALSAKPPLAGRSYSTISWSLARAMRHNAYEAYLLNEAMPWFQQRNWAVSNNLTTTAAQARVNVFLLDCRSNVLGCNNGR